MTRTRKPEGRLRQRACAVVLGLALTGLTTAAMAPAAPVPPGPRLASIALISSAIPKREAPDSFMALTTFGPSGEQPRDLLKQRLDGRGIVPAPFSQASWSADGASIALVGANAKGGSVYLAGANGSNPRFLVTGGDPVLSPDGMTLAFSRSRVHFPKPTVKVPPSGVFYASTTAWVMNLATGETRQLTPWRNGLDNVPASFSPDGSVLALTRDDNEVNGPRIVLLRTATGEETELRELAEEPAISPDGTRIAFVGYRNPTQIEAEENRDYTIGELYTMGLDGTGVKRLTRNRDRLESSPSWDPSGQRLAYVSAEADTGFDPGLALLFPEGNAIEQMNADGSCRRKVRSSPKVALYGVHWQPGPERAAARIVCLAKGAGSARRAGQPGLAPHRGEYESADG